MVDFQFRDFEPFAFARIVPFAVAVVRATMGPWKMMASMKEVVASPGQASSMDGPVFRHPCADVAASLDMVANCARAG